MNENLTASRILLRYKFCLLLGLLIVGIQVFLGYESLGIPYLSTDSNGISLAERRVGAAHHKPSTGGVLVSNHNSVGDDEDGMHSQKRAGQSSSTKPTTVRPSDNRLSPEQLGFVPECEITAKEAISALQRAKSKDCRKHIAHIACAIQAGKFYAPRLPSYCPTGNYTANAPLGCYHDEKDTRLLPDYFTNLRTSNSPLRCNQLCLQSGYPYAGVQYGTECFCGSDPPPSAAKLADSSCNMKCSGDAREICGGFYSMNVYETGISKFTPQIAETVVKANVERVRIAFLLTLNGRALRQVHRLIRALYSPTHIFYIHVDARQDYLYRKLLELESKFPNIHLARKRFSSIWGGASLLTMLLQCMEDLLSSKWQWDFVINLSESDFPVKTVDKLTEFLTANKDRNFVKSHGRKTQRFIQKQGLDKTFVECDTHMWRIGDRQLPAGIQMDGGSDWIALSRPFVRFVITESETEELLSGLLVVFRYTLLPVESFFHTVLRNTRYCATYVDNNLHMINWKRKLGCKCQYKHVVDWCGCSPNDFKPEDWTRIQNSEPNMVYFARKFEPIINQAVIRQLEEWLFGAYSSDFVNVNGYWQSFYHADDQPSSTDDITRTIAESLMRIAMRKSQQLRPQRFIELTHYMHNDQYKGFLMRYTVVEVAHNNRTLELESRIRPVQYEKTAKNSKFASRLRNFEVSSEFDQKEQISRNYAKILGPYSEPVLSFTFAGANSASHASHSYNVTILWIDPLGQLQDFKELHIEDAQTDVINFSKPILKHPLTPGVWTVKLIGRMAIYAQTKFLIAPLAIMGGHSIRPERAQVVNAGAGTGGLSLPSDFDLPPEWQQFLSSTENVQSQLQTSKLNAQRSGDSLLQWVDDLVAKFFLTRDTCAVNAIATHISTDALASLPLCHDTQWSSLAPDPKSDVYALLNANR